MRTLLAIAIALLPLLGMGQDSTAVAPDTLRDPERRICLCLTRAQLEAGADSALKGQTAVMSEAELRVAAQNYIQALSKKDRVTAKSDSTAAAERFMRMDIERRYAAENQKVTGLEWQAQKDAVYVSIGKWTIRIAVATVIVGTVVVLKNELVHP